jgi:hypothetical protein
MRRSRPRRRGRRRRDDDDEDDDDDRDDGEATATASGTRIDPFAASGYARPVGRSTFLEKDRRRPCSFFEKKIRFLFVASRRGFRGVPFVFFYHIIPSTCAYRSMLPPT